MGCDIHAYIDYDRHWEAPETKKLFVDNFCQVHIGRNYGLFYVLAGVRGYDQTQHFEPKGMPEGVSWRVSDEYMLTVNNEYADSEGYCSEEAVEGWGLTSKVITDGKLKRVPCPDWHSASWLTVDELETAYYEYYLGAAKGMSSEEIVLAIALSGRDWIGRIPEIEAVLGAMKALEAIGHKARFVFWFDN